MIDTHSHIYSEEFDADRADVIQRAREAGIQYIIMPNVDSESLPRMLTLEREYPDYCFPTIGLHPTSVKEDYKTELYTIKSELTRREYIAIGEIGIDLYWDKQFYTEQVDAFQTQIEWALEYQLPVIIHVRDSFRETMNALAPYKNKGLTGIFHSFTGSFADAQEIINFGGFKLGINGIVTFKNSGLADTLNQIPLEYVVLETDSPYLTPTPFRGKRNESAYINYVCLQLTSIYNLTRGEIIDKTTQNALKVFKKLPK